MTTLNKNLLVAETSAEGGYRQATFEEILEAAKAALTNRVKKGTALTSPKLNRDYLMTRLSGVTSGRSCSAHSFPSGPTQRRSFSSALSGRNSVHV